MSATFEPRSVEPDSWVRWIQESKPLLLRCWPRLVSMTALFILVASGFTISAQGLLASVPQDLVIYGYAVMFSGVGILFVLASQIVCITGEGRTLSSGFRAVGDSIAGMRGPAAGFVAFCAVIVSMGLSVTVMASVDSLNGGSIYIAVGAHVSIWLVMAAFWIVLIAPFANGVFLRLPLIVRHGLPMGKADALVGRALEKNPWLASSSAVPKTNFLMFPGALVPVLVCDTVLWPLGVIAAAPALAWGAFSYAAYVDIFEGREKVYLARAGKVGASKPLGSVLAPVPSND